ncbi:MAG: hypothetical protein PHD41_00630 [Methanosarcinaceae archaeon]|nr:hypothetical protein [Methanosarcinaceae archaeon]MDD4331917.1 hypothetical protein [Methanosarcinaceae archaeon]
MRYKTSLGLNENLVAALSYIAGWPSGILLLLLERQNRFVRFHAMQSVLVFMPVALLIFLTAWIPYVGWLFADGLGFGAVFLLVILMYMAYRGSKFKLPFVGKIAYEYAYKE